VLAQAEFQGKAIFSRHTVQVCAWSPEGRWSDPCMWDRMPQGRGHVMIERGMKITLDTMPPPLASLTVRMTAGLAMFSLRSACMLDKYSMTWHAKRAQL
jgi:hypothetical protein